jgi:ATP-dependent RNA helicase RhlE
MNNLLIQAMTFESFGLHESLLKVLPEIGFEKPTPIQQQAIPVVLSGKDLLGSAQTGTGKTAAFLLPVLHRLLTEPSKGTQVLVLEPTRELALQVEEHAKILSKYTPFSSACVYGGVPFGPQEKAFADGVEIIAATPGRLLDHLRQGNARFDKLRILVLDEVDRMLDMGFLPDVRSILRQLPEQRQTLFFSATVPSEIGRLADGMLKEPVRIAITPERKTAEGVTQQIYPVSEHLKAKLLEVLLSHEHVTSALVFTRTKQGADKVCAVVERQGLPVSRIHGDLSQSQRLKALAQFKDGEVKFLVATDIAARGLDVEGISHVINYDLPDSPEDYIHRVGRTARAGETGHAYSLFSPRDAAALAAIERHLAQKIEKVTMPDFDYKETLGLQHEVRQGHNVRDFEDLGRPGAPFQPQRPQAYKDADERASIVLLFSPTASEADAVSFKDHESPGRGGAGGGEEGHGRRRRKGRGGRDGERRPDSPERSHSGGGGGRPGFGAPRTERFEKPAGERGDGERRDRHQSNASMSASDVLRKASDQKAVVSSDMLDLRPRNESDPEPAPAPIHNGPRPVSNGALPNPSQPRENFQAREGFQPREGSQPGEGGGKRRRRRRGRGKGPQDPQGQQSQPQGGRPQSHDRVQQQGRGRAPENGRDGRGNERPERDRHQQRRQESPGQGQELRGSAPKPSLWQRLKSGLGLGSGPGGGLGDKW